VMGWTLDGDAFPEIDRLIANTIKDPVGPEFMAPPARTMSRAQSQAASGAHDDSVPGRGI
jgi:hypothetical protein